MRKRMKEEDDDVRIDRRYFSLNATMEFVWWLVSRPRGSPVGHRLDGRTNVYPTATKAIMVNERRDGDGIPTPTPALGADNAVQVSSKRREGE